MPDVHPISDSSISNGLSISNEHSISMYYSILKSINGYGEAANGSPP